MLYEEEKCLKLLTISTKLAGTCERFDVIVLFRLELKIRNNILDLTN